MQGEEPCNQSTSKPTQPESSGETFTTDQTAQQVWYEKMY